jgi:hypothetical protein
MEILILIVVIGCVIAAVAAFSRTPQGKAVTVSSSENQSHLDQMERTYQGGQILGRRDLHKFGLAVSASEASLIPVAPATFAEEKSHGRYVGTSIRVAKGVRISGGRADSIPTIKTIDQGNLIVTNQRIVFLGAMRTHEVRWSQLEGYTYSDAALVIRKARREKVMYFELPGTAHIVGRMIEMFLAHDDWEFVDMGDDLAILQHGNAPDPFADDNKAMAQALASLMTLILNADGVITEAELNEARRIVNVYEKGSFDEAPVTRPDALDDALEGRGISAERAISHLQQKCEEFEPYRQDIMTFFELVVDADGRSPEEQAVLNEIRLAVLG